MSPKKLYDERYSFSGPNVSILWSKLKTINDQGWNPDFYNIPIIYLNEPWLSKLHLHQILANLLQRRNYANKLIPITHQYKSRNPLSCANISTIYFYIYIYIYDSKKKFANSSQQFNSVCAGIANCTVLSCFHLMFCGSSIWNNMEHFPNNHR